MTAYLLLPLLAFFINIGLMGCVLRERPRPESRSIFALFLFCMALWGGAIYLMRTSSTLEQAFFWDKLVIVNFALIGVLYLHFSYRFAELTPKRWVLPFAYSMILVWAFLTFTEQTITGMQNKFYGYAPVLGYAFYPLLFFIYTCIFAGLTNVVQTYRRHPSPIMRNRAAYLLAGTLASIAGATTDYLPALDVSVYPLGIVGNILFGVFATVAVARPHLVDFRTAVRRTIAYAIVSLLVLGVYALIVLAAAQIVEVEFTVPLLVLILVLLVPTVALWRYAAAFVVGAVDRGFYGERYSALRSLERFSQEIKDITDLRALSNTLLGLMRTATEARSADLLLPDSEYEMFVSTAAIGGKTHFRLPYDPEGSALGRLMLQDRVVPAQEFALFPEWTAIPLEEREKLDEADVRMYVPLKSRGKLTGVVLLGPKAKGDPYTQEDIDLLQTAAYQAATGMENARLYQELREQLQKLRETQSQLVQFEKMASVGTLAAGVAHEISNPIFSIAGRTEMLLDQPGDHLKSEAARRYVTVIDQMARRVSLVVRDLLAFSRQDQSMAPSDLNELLERTLRLVENDLRLTGITVTCKYADDLPPVSVNGNLVQQVIMNLVLNAKDAMPDGGALYIETGAADGQVFISCRDTGQGIPKEQLPRIFDAFYTSKEPGKGTGLGLYICQRIVREHGGRIDVESSFGQGSTFTVLLPLDEGLDGEQDADIAAETVSVTRPTRSNGARTRRARSARGGEGGQPRTASTNSRR